VNLSCFEDLARQFELLARLVEMLGDNPFKARTYRFAADKMRSRESEKISKEAIKELSKEKGIGKAVVGKSLQFLESGRIKKIEELKSQIPLPLFLLASESNIPGRTLHKLYEELKDLSLKDIVVTLKQRASKLGLDEDFIRRLEESVRSE